MTGRSHMIIKDLINNVCIKDISVKYGITESAIYRLAKRHLIPLPERALLSTEEKKEKKRISDAARYKRVRKIQLERADIPMPIVPFVASKITGLGLYNTKWIVMQGHNRSNR